MNKRYLILISSLIVMISCSKEIISRFGGFRQPANFPMPVYRMNNNPITEDGFILGRKLFYEPRLSRNNTISCGSCHIQSAAFTHHGHDVSHGIDDRLGTRNAQPIMNLAWSPDFFWDGGVFDLDLQPIVPITNHVEMDESVQNVQEKLRQLPEYPNFFKRAFGTEEINTTRMMKALSQFMLLCISASSRYDSVMNGLQKFTETETQGYELFKQHCNGCHKEPLFTDHSFRNNGLPPGLSNDEGRYQITLNPADRYKFKVPSLRNLLFTVPYMHDGRFITLDAVLDHYNEGIHSTPHLDPLLKNGIKLSLLQRQQLLAFLKTLIDRDFLINPLLAEQ